MPNAKKRTLPRRSIPRTGILIMMIVLFALSLCLLILASVLWAYSPGKPVPVLDGNGRPVAGSISEKTRVVINGAEMGMFIRGRDTANPVLLYLHGGMPEYFLEQKFPSGLEEYFTVVWWEQRGSGLSFSKNIPQKPITLEQMLADTRAVTEYLRNRFGKEKIYLMGHSGGTFIGILAVARTPELYHAYIGAAQMSDQCASEKQAYDYMIKEYSRIGNVAMVRKLEAAPVTVKGGMPRVYLAVRDPAMHRLGIGTTRDMRSVVTGIIFPSFMCPAYTLAEKVALWHGKSRSGVSVLWNTMLNTNLAEQVMDLAIPVYFFHGRFDYTVSYPLAKAFFEKLNAPRKKFYTFELSAHSPMFEEPEKMRRIFLREILVQKAANRD